MPFDANPSASISSELFFPGRIGELPLRSVGPEPESNSTTGIALLVSFGSSSVLCKVLSAGAAATGGGSCATAATAVRALLRARIRADRMCRLSLHLSYRAHDFRHGADRRARPTMAA